MSAAFWLGWARRFRGELSAIVALSIFASLAALAVPWFAGQVLGGVVSAAAPTGAIDLGQAVALLVGTLVLLTALNIAAAMVSEIAALRILTELRKRAHAHVQLLPISVHESARRGDLLAVTAYEVGNLADFLANTLAGAPAMVLTALGAIAILFWLDPVMALIVPIMIPAFVLLARLVGRRLRSVAQDVRAAEIELIAQAERDLEMLPATKSYALEEARGSAFAETAERAFVFGRRKARLGAFVGPLVALFAALATIAVLVLASERLGPGSGPGSPGELFAFLLYATLLTRPVGALASSYSAYQIARGSLEKFEDVLALPPEPGYAAKGRIERAKGPIRFDKVDFAYPGRAPVLSDFNLTIQPGETVALTGPNGVGKSTIVRLLLRFYDPLAGTITLDGRDIATIAVQDLRRQFGYVPQRALLFDGTIAENIALGVADGVALQRAVELAQASDMIAELSEGFETRIGDSGVRLSGGQRQRLALARALYHDPPIYILDEATAMYDLESEAAFVEQCLEAIEGRTVILITHRPASLALADRILDMTLAGPLAAEAQSKSG
ncbi:MAG: ABC transporter ATP-binding protein [Erythrobacter sp.]|nr:ABC transporter ATP-binding protein [Erythrobacter sp.]